MATSAIPSSERCITAALPAQPALVLSGGECWIVILFNKCGNTNKLKYIISSPGKSFLFFVTSFENPGISSTGDRVQMKVKASPSLLAPRCIIYDP